VSAAPLPTLTPAKLRALRWLPADGGWRHSPGNPLWRTLDALTRRGIAGRQWLEMRGVEGAERWVKCWALTIEGIRVRKEIGE